jgi:hypothetical protein
MGRSDYRTRVKIAFTPERLVAAHKAVSECLHKAYKLIFFHISQTEISNSLGVHILSRLRRWPACHAFAGVVGLAAR